MTGFPGRKPETDVRATECPDNTTVSSLYFHSRAAPPSRTQPAGSAREQVLGSTYIFAVFRLGEVDQVIVVHVLGVEQVTVLLLAEGFRVNPVGPEEFLVCHTECLPYGLRDQLGL